MSEDYIEHLKLALKAQIDIRDQLTEEIKNLQSGPRQPKSSQAKLNFYSSTLRKATEERFALAQEIHNQRMIKDNDFVKRLANVQKKQNISQEYLKEIKDKFNRPVPKKIMADAELTDDDVKNLIKELQEEFSHIEMREQEVNSQVQKARAELHTLQQQRTLEKLKAAKQIWESEVNEENRLHSPTSFSYRTTSNLDNFPTPFAQDTRPMTRRYSETGIYSNLYRNSKKSVFEPIIETP